MFCLAPATVVVISPCCSRLREISSDLYGHLGCRPCVSRFRRGTMLTRGRPHFSYRTAPYPTRGIMTGERQVRWNPDHQGMRNEQSYTRPPAVQVVRPQNHYRLPAAPVPVRRHPARYVNGVMLIPWSPDESRHLARAQNYASNTVTAASQNYAGPQSFVWSEQYVLPIAGFPLVSNYESNYEVPDSPVPSNSGSVDSADTPNSLDVDWATTHRKVFDTIKTLEWSGPVALLTCF